MTPAASIGIGVRPGPATPWRSGPKACPADREHGNRDGLGLGSGTAPRPLPVVLLPTPAGPSGVFRGRATANHLARAGWDVTVVTAPREFFSYHLGGASDESLEATVDPRVTVVRPPMITYHWEKDVRRFGAFRGTFPVLADRLYQRVQNLIFPEYYLGWAPGVIRSSLAMHRKRRFDVVIATGNPFVSFAVARLLGRRFRCRTCVDYRDSWTYNQFNDQLIYPEGGKAMRWEARIVRDAAEIVFVNDVMRQLGGRPVPVRRRPDDRGPQWMGPGGSRPGHPHPARSGPAAAVRLPRHGHRRAPARRRVRGLAQGACPPAARRREFTIHGHLGLLSAQRRPAPGHDRRARRRGRALPGRVQQDRGRQDLQRPTSWSFCAGGAGT